MNIINPPGATPLEQEDMEGLLPQHLTTQGQLNEWEQANILEAENRFLSRKHKNLLSLEFIQKLHKAMFGMTWRWAGKFRHRQTNIGVEWHQIATQLKLLCDDVSYQLEHNTYPIDELAVRFHHRLVLIHAFPNGNGRHARLMADLLLRQNGKDRFSWGRKTLNGNLANAGETRRKYLSALRKADQGQFDELIEFARS